MNRITTIIASSPIPSAPGIDHISRTIESLEYVPELAESPVLIVFDAPRDADLSPKYDEYKQNVAHFCQDRPNIRLLHLAEWGHLSGVMERAIERVTTPFVFAQQHDLPLVRAFDLDRVLECLAGDAAVKYIRLNRRPNIAAGWDQNPLFGVYENPYLPLMKTGCWSDQNHVATTAYYRDVVLPEVRGKQTFMEAVLNRQMRHLEGEELEAAHRRLGTFVYGAPGDEPVIAHTNGREAGPMLRRNVARASDIFPHS